MINLKSKTIGSVILTPDGTVCKQANIIKEIVGKTIIINLNCEFNAVSSALPYTLIASGVPSELIPKNEIYAYAQILTSTEGLTNNACLVQIKNASVSDAGKIFIKTAGGIANGCRLRVSIPILSA